MTSIADIDVAGRRGISLKALFGVHSVAAGVAEFAANAPMVAGLLAVVAAFILLQAGVLAACTLHVPRCQMAAGA
jgi:hypothetical protein